MDDLKIKISTEFESVKEISDKLQSLLQMVEKQNGLNLHINDVSNDIDGVKKQIEQLQMIIDKTKLDVNTEDAKREFLELTKFVNKQLNDSFGKEFSEKFSKDLMSALKNPSEFKQLANNIGVNIGESMGAGMSREISVEANTMLKQMKDIFKGKSIYIPVEIDKEMSNHFGDTWRQQFGSRMTRFTTKDKSALGVDQVYKELSNHNALKGFFNENEITNESDQLQHMLTVLKQVRATKDGMIAQPMKSNDQEYTKYAQEQLSKIYNEYQNINKEVVKYNSLTNKESNSPKNSNTGTIDSMEDLIALEQKVKSQGGFFTEDLKSAQSVLKTLLDSGEQYTLQTHKWLADGKDLVEVYTVTEGWIQSEVGSLEEVQKLYQGIVGEVNLIDKRNVESTEEVKQFTAEVKKANGEVYKLRYALDEDGDKYKLSDVTHIDKTAELKERQAQYEQKLRRDIEKEKEESNRTAQKLLYEEEQQRIQLTTEAQKKIERMIIGSNETISERELRINRTNAQEYENIWENAIRDKEVKMAKKSKFLNSLGAVENVDLGNVNTQSNRKDITELIGQVGGVNAEVRKIDTLPYEKMGEEIRKVSYRVKEGKDKWQEYQMAIVKSGETGQLSVRKLDLGTKDVINRQMGMLGKMKHAFESVFSFSIVSGGIYALTDQIKKATEYVVGMDTALTNLSKVMDNLTNVQMEDMRKTSIQLGKELGKSSVDIVEGMAEFGRVTKNLDEIKEMTRTAVMASNVTDLSVADASKALTTSMINFQIPFKDSMKVLDQWNEIQNNFRKMSAEVKFSLIDLEAL